MSNTIDTGRNSFFPNAKTAAEAKAKQNAGVGGVYTQRNNVERAQAINTATKNDAKVEINDAIKDFSRIKKAVDMAPEIDNTDKIAKLKAQIQAGTYQVDYDALADKMLQSEF